MCCECEAPTPAKMGLPRVPPSTQPIPYVSSCPPLKSRVQGLCGWVGVVAVAAARVCM